MVQKQTWLRVSDNSGAKWAKCIYLFKKKYARLADLVLVVLKVFKDDKRLQKKKKYTGLIIAVRLNILRLNGFTISFKRNRVLLFFEKKKFSGTRIYGPLCRELRNKSVFSEYKYLFLYAESVI